MPITVKISEFRGDDARCLSRKIFGLTVFSVLPMRYSFNAIGTFGQTSCEALS